jgi:hypothetical protein
MRQPDRVFTNLRGHAHLAHLFDHVVARRGLCCGTGDMWHLRERARVKLGDVGFRTRDGGTLGRALACRFCRRVADHRLRLARRCRGGEDDQ